MKRIRIFILLLAAGTMLCNAQTTVTMRDVFSQMPDSLLPYLSHNNKLDLVDFIDSGMDAEVSNSFDEQVKLTKLTSDYLQLQPSEASSIEMKLLPYTGTTPDSTSNVVCVVTTLGKQPQASIVRFYTSSWTPMDIQDPIAGYGNLLIEKPDTMDIEQFDELRQAVSPLTVSASLSETEETITMKVSPRIQPRQENDSRNNMSINDILRQITLKWGGKTFKEN